MGEYVKAEPLLKEALQILQKVLGPEHPNTTTNLNNLALLEFDIGRIDEVRALTRQAFAAELKTLSKIFSFTSVPALSTLLGQKNMGAALRSHRVVLERCAPLDSAR
jgi:hypothetical protein